MKITSRSAVFFVCKRKYPQGLSGKDAAKSIDVHSGEVKKTEFKSNPRNSRQPRRWRILLHQSSKASQHHSFKTLTSAFDHIGIADDPCLCNLAVLYEDIRLQTAGTAHGKSLVDDEMVPAVLCLNDQGGKRIEAHEEVAGPLRSQEHGHQPLVMATQQGGAEIGIDICPTITSAAGTSGNNQPILYENHGIDSRYTGPHPVAPTMSARYGTGGNNVPLIGQEEPETYCIVGNVIDRQPKNDGNGKGYQPDIAYTLTGMDRHAVFSRQRIDVFKADDIASTESARQGRDATDLILQSESEDVGPRLIRRLTPLECERLQGFPDGWTDIPGASDSSRYKALGNSVAIPCVEYIMAGIAAALTESE